MYMQEPKVFLEKVKTVKKFHQLLIKLGEFFDVKFEGEFDEDINKEEWVTKYNADAYKAEGDVVMTLNTLVSGFMSALPPSTYFSEKVTRETLILVKDEVQTFNAELAALVDTKQKSTDAKVSVLSASLKANMIELEEAIDGVKTSTATGFRAIDKKISDLSERISAIKITDSNVEGELQNSMKITTLNTEVESLRSIISDIRKEMKKVAKDGGGMIRSAVSYGGSAAGSNTQVQFNDNGSMAGSSKMVFDKTTGVLTLNGKLALAGGGGFEFTALPTYGKIQTYSSLPLHLNPEGNNVIVGSATSQMAIGTTTFATGRKLSLNEGTMTNNQIGGIDLIGNITGFVGSNGISFTLNNTTANQTGYVRLDRTASSAFVGMTINSQSRDGIRFMTHASSPVEVGRITDTGRFGFGTTAAQSEGHFNSSDDAQLILSGTLNTPGETSGIEFRYNGGITNTNIARIMAVTGSGGGGDLNFDTAPGGGSAYTTKMTLARAGILTLGGGANANSNLVVGSTAGNVAFLSPSFTASSSSTLRFGVNTYESSAAWATVDTAISGWILQMGAANADNQSYFQLRHRGAGTAGTTSPTSVFSVNSHGGIVVGYSAQQAPTGGAIISGSVGIGTTAPTHTLTLGSTGTGIALYNTADQTTNYERGRLYWNSNVLTLTTDNAGSGTARSLILTNGANRSLTISPATSAVFQFAAGSSGLLTGAISVTNSTSLSSGTYTQVALTPTINQSSTAGYTALLVNPTETTVGNGTKLLADFQVGGVSKTIIDNAGNVCFTGGSRLSLGGTNIGLEYLYSPSGSGQTYLAGRNNLVFMADNDANGSGVIAFKTRDNSQDATTNLRMIISNTGLVGINQGTPTSLLHLGAGTATASTAPLKFTAGTALTTPEAGTMEFSNSETGLTFTAVSTRRAVVLDTATQTLTNKFITPQVQSVADAGGTLTPVSITNDIVIATALSQATTIAAPTGSPVQGEKLTIRLKDDGTARALTWNAIYRAIGVTLPTTTVISKIVYVGCIYNSTDTKWDVVSVAQEA